MDRQPEPGILAATTASVASPVGRGITFDDIEELGARLESIQGEWKREVAAPSGVKQAPSFNATQLAELCGKTPDQMATLLKKAAEWGLPDGGEGRTRNFTLAEARQWIQKVEPRPRRPEGAPGATVCVCNFKGGVGKTVISVAVAQALSLRGYKVLCIDFDPQGSLTSVLGIDPTSVDETETVLVLTAPKTYDYASETLQTCIRSTYWDGIDLVPGNHGLFSGEFYLPLRQTTAHKNEPGFKFYEVLDKALDSGIREEYDYIIIDTPPALSYMTLTTFWAADALLLPLPPDGIDFASSAQFWSMLAEIASTTEAPERRGQDGKKTFSWVRVVPSKVNHATMHTKDMMDMMKLGYQDMLASTEIPETAAVRVGGARMESVYDISKYIGDRRTLLRARQAYDKLVDEIDFLTHKTVWGSAALNGGAA